jgi:two-component sensor histidine kinase
MRRWRKPPRTKPCFFTRERAVSLFALVLGITTSATSAAPPLGSAFAVRSLSSEQAELAWPVELTGVVIFVDSGATIFLQDDTAGTFFRTRQVPAPALGSLVRVRGKTFPGLYLPGIEEATFETLETVPMPSPLVASYEDLSSGRYHYQRVAAEGVIRRVRAVDENLTILRLALGTRSLDIEVDQAASPTTTWVDRRVRVTGLAAGRINDQRQLVEPYLRCRDWSDIATLREATDPAVLLPLPPEALLPFAVEGSPEHRVAVEGTVLAIFGNSHSDRDIFLRIGETALRARLDETNAPPTLPEIGDSVKIVGFPEMTGFRASLADAIISTQSPGQEKPSALHSPLHEILDGRAEGDLVCVRGQLVDAYRGESGATLILGQDESRTIRVESPVWRDDWVPGSQLAVIGICQSEDTYRSERYRSAPAMVFLKCRSQEDITIIQPPRWWTIRRLSWILGGLFFTMILATLWITLLQIQVRHQTNALRLGIRKEVAAAERQHLAREFHDSLEQNLTGLALRMDAATARSSEARERAFLEDSRRLLARIQEETRHLISDLRRSSDKELRLYDALCELVLEQHGLSPELKLDLETNEPIHASNFPASVVHHLKMIASEAITNSRKHASAQSILIRLAETSDSLQLSITDDGAGLAGPDETQGRPGHFGCIGMRERCRKLGASIDWISPPEGGTMVQVRLPLPLLPLEDLP